MKRWFTRLVSKTSTNNEILRRSSNPSQPSRNLSLQPRTSSQGRFSTPIFTSKSTNLPPKYSVKAQNSALKISLAKRLALKEDKEISEPKQVTGEAKLDDSNKKSMRDVKIRINDELTPKDLRIRDDLHSAEGQDRAGPLNPTDPSDALKNKPESSTNDRNRNNYDDNNFPNITARSNKTTTNIEKSLGDQNSNNAEANNRKDNLETPTNSRSAIDSSALKQNNNNETFNKEQKLVNFQQKPTNDDPKPTNDTSQRSNDQEPTSLSQVNDRNDASASSTHVKNPNNSKTNKKRKKSKRKHR